MILWELFLGFLKVGCFAFGGSYGAIPLIRDVVMSYGWLTDDMLSAMIAVSESTPGPIMVNMATYVGSSQAGIAGAAVATFAVVLPAFIVILLALCVLKNAMQNRYFQAVLGGLRPCVTGVILATGCYMVLNSCRADAGGADLRALLLTVLLAAVNFGGRRLLKRRVPPVTLILIAAALGLAVYGV